MIDRNLAGRKRNVLKVRISLKREKSFSEKEIKMKGNLCCCIFYNQMQYSKKNLFKETDVHDDKVSYENVNLSNLKIILNY